MVRSLVAVVLLLPLGASPLPDGAAGAWEGGFEVAPDGWITGASPESWVLVDVDEGGATIDLRLGVDTRDPDTGGDPGCVVFGVTAQRIVWTAPGVLAGPVAWSIGGGPGGCGLDDFEARLTPVVEYASRIEAVIDDGTMRGNFFEVRGPDAGYPYPFVAQPIPTATTTTAPTVPTARDPEQELWAAIAGAQWLGDDTELGRLVFDRYHAEWSSGHFETAARQADRAVAWFDANARGVLRDEDTDTLIRSILDRAGLYAELRRGDGRPIFPSLQAALPIIGELALRASADNGELPALGRFVSLLIRQVRDHAWGPAS